VTCLYELEFEKIDPGYPPDDKKPKKRGGESVEDFYPTVIIVDVSQCETPQKRR
jgi:hypothetical protein